MRLLKLIDGPKANTSIPLLEKDMLKVGMSSYDVELDTDDGRIHLMVLQNGMDVGEVIYDDGEIVWIHVEPFFRKTGLGSAMLKFLQDKGYPVVMPDARTDDGKAFFNKLDQNGRLDEGANTNCIVVDVQPEYTGLNDGNELPWIDELMEFLNKQGNILMFVNAEETGLTFDTIDDVKVYWEDSGFDPRKWQQTEIVDKGYGYLRAWMDEGVQPNVIIKVIRELYQQGVNDTRDLYGGDVEQLAAALGEAWEDWMADDPLIVEWTSLAQLKRFSGSLIMGGGRDECLREVELLMNAFNIKYRRVEDFVYG